MTNKDYTHILAIVDRSGSMSWGNVHLEMANALNIYFDEQAQLPGICKVDYAQFDTQYETVFEDLDATDAEAIIQPRGSTALIDAIGIGTVNLGTKLDALAEDDRPGTVLIVIVTDGGENASREYTLAQVREMVEKQESEFAWEYVFLGANIDAVATGTSFGMKAGNTMTFDTANIGVTAASLGNYTTTYRSAGKAEFTEDDRQKAVDKS